MRSPTNITSYHALRSFILFSLTGASFYVNDVINMLVNASIVRHLTAAGPRLTIAIVNAL